MSLIVLFFSLFVLCFSSPVFPARTTPHDKVTTVLTAGANGHNATWRDFARFLDASRDSHVSGMSDLKRYFQRFGYLEPSDTNFTDVFDDRFETALISYQTRLGLPVTGRLDRNTMSEITAPRCGVTDAAHSHAHAHSHSLHATRRYAFFEGKPRWVHMNGSPATLTYAFREETMVDYLTPSEVRTVFSRAFARWADVIPVSFAETTSYQSADIRIGFYGGDHGDGEAFDGVLGVLAHAFSPENGRFHLDAAETWAVDFDKEKSREAVDLESVATHEIGHILGLGHSSVKEAVMYPSLSPRTRKVDLRIDDVEGVQNLYGSNPNFSYTSLLESEKSSNRAAEIDGRRIAWTTSFVVALLLLFLWT